MFAQRLRELRSEKGVVQKDVANFLNITTSAYGFYEQGKRVPDTDIMIKLSNYFNVSLDYLLGKTDVRNYTDDSNITIALNSDTDYDELPKEAKDEINNFIEYVKQKYKDKK
ncbi:helix-turn-helix domain-containing protein [Clostridium diolis]|uniref:Transcriptional regulator n=1 Tax=Clostridium diolis TaxID=223919 RepID=A0AAV3VYH4_9CLOT|nr:helix-turn-helix transcriptional regulator [Clostridium diolis]QES72157.1 helix-turn-helix transcriptional regulator [Clostridium diolis]GEA30232.1 transcriptional regulator [Clostridium diolis]